MEPNIMNCSPELGAQWFQLATMNGMAIQKSDEGFTIVSDSGSVAVPHRQNPGGEYRITINRIDDRELRTRLVLMTFASGGDCRASPELGDFDAICSCPKGFFDRWRSGADRANVTVNNECRSAGSLCCATGELVMGDDRADFVAGVAYIDETAAPGEFIACSSRFTWFSRARVRGSLERELDRATQLGARRLRHRELHDCQMPPDQQRR